MARMARVVIPKYPHHVTQRGNRRQKTFFCEADYRSACRAAEFYLWLDSGDPVLYIV